MMGEKRKKVGSNRLESARMDGVKGAGGRPAEATKVKLDWETGGGG